MRHRMVLCRVGCRVFRSVEPAWNDQNLPELASHVSSPLFFAYVRAAIGSAIQPTSTLAGVLDRYHPEGEAETADLPRIRVFAETADDPWRRDIPLHLTASALIVHPGTGRVLLRWHQRYHAWRHVGGHGDVGESDPLAIAAREASEETGLHDLEPWPDAAIRHVVIVDVPAGNGEPAHQHADIRYFMATRTPDQARAEHRMPRCAGCP